MEVKINITGLSVIAICVVFILGVAGACTYFGVIKSSDFIVVIATLLAPILAVQVQVIREQIKSKTYDEQRKKQEAESRQLWGFRQMMAYRANPVDPLFVQALNIVPVDFKGIESVENAWKKYFEQLCVRANTQENWIELCNDRRCELLAAMAKYLGFEFSLRELKDEKYMSEGMVNDMNMKNEIFKGIHDIVVNKNPLPVLSCARDTPKDKNEAKAGGED
ncbi:hypothetical protein LZ667_21775 [Hafnia alvei]|uniref:DUF6680 family protein n=1 Tax=Hafnia alvei TaxID=569 RepID=UPI001F3FABCC|nr:DUF6680 family protein [Hafnia alvei]MCE9873993.1 hypothetical protein [Hafnia alvei]